MNNTHPDRTLRTPTRLLVVGLLVLVLLAGLSIPSPTQAGRDAPVLQAPIYTPTPRPDGRIIYIVQANDTLLSIALISGLEVEEIRELNNLSGDTIYEGQELLLGLAGPPEVTITPGPTPTPTSVLPTPTREAGTGILCILLFDDRNGDSLRQEDEPSIPNGAISVSNRLGSVSETVDTLPGLEPQCFEDLSEGQYTISVAVPSGYNPTTQTSYVLPLAAGDQTYIDFGAQANSETLAQAPILPAEGERSPLLGIIGGLFLLIGLGLAIFAGRWMRLKS